VGGMSLETIQMNVMSSQSFEECIVGDLSSRRFSIQSSRHHLVSKVLMDEAFSLGGASRSAVG